MEEQLQQAYQYMQRGEHKLALSILAGVCRAEPDNPDAWWLVANASDNPDQQRIALKHVIEYDPFNEDAVRMLKELDSSPESDFSIALVLIVGLLVGVSLAGVGLVLRGALLQDEPPAAELVILPTQITLPPSLTPNPSDTPTATFTSFPTETPTPLPATWTPQPTNTIADFPTPTPWLLTKTPLATADPALFGTTYWEGIGDGWDLDRFTRSGGRHMRFFDFPIKVFLKAPDNPLWQNALTHAIGQINPHVPMEQVFVEADATLTVRVLGPDAFAVFTGCPAFEAAGCGTIYDVGDFGGGDRFHRILGEATISTDSRNPVGTMLHEMLHAIGVMVHSWDENDIMYPYETSRRTLSQRDINTLQRLYANPSYAD